MRAAESMDPNLPISQRASAAAPYLAKLNPEQRAAVEALDGPVLVLAGAGTGKTRVLTTRLAHLLATGRAKSWEVLAVTFTNKASREMRERVEHLLGPGAGGIRWLGTFHSVSALMLRKHAELAGLKSSFTILDTDDQIRLLKQIIEAEGIDEKRWTARALAGQIDAWKNRALIPRDVPKGEAHAWGDGKAIAIYAAYQERLKILNACDFGDLLLHVIDIFKTRPDVLADYHRRLPYIMVDEYQDTNVAQYLWLRLLAQGSNNLCVVGDDDQSIYGWRGAEVDNILRFERDFPGAKVVRLERNYRSTGNILAAASKLIDHNTGRLGKTLWTEDEPGDRVKVRGVWDGEGEARLIGDDIEHWVSERRERGSSGPQAGADAGLKARAPVYSQCAVLVRAAWQMRAFEERFLMLRIPYKVIGGPRFFERAEVRDAHAYLRLIRSPDDDLAFERIINQPKRGLADATLKKLHAEASARTPTFKPDEPLFDMLTGEVTEYPVPENITASTRFRSLTEAAREIVKGDALPLKARTSLKTFLADLDRWREKRKQVSHVELAEIVLDESGYTEMLKNDKSPTAQTRLENLKELVQAMGHFDTLEAYLEHVELVLDIDTGGDGDEVHLSTLHAAKGLEWPLVFLPGWEETVFPSQRSMDENGVKGLEEERRLAYVGITRARESARISFAANRQIYGRWQNVLPSRFIDELPEANVDAISETGYGRAGVAENGARFEAYAPGAGFNSGYESPGWKRAQDRMGEGKSFGRAPAIEGEARLVAKSADSDAKFAVGARIFHDKFGYGRIRAVEGNKLTVAFEKAGEKKVIDSFVKAA
ncbi:MAG: UvrD-helicase domain-containing protein [Hyphomonadaceae bacterium]|nr:UvrD-helicase domain-containing protein [Hyphomonadaceae bacterium]